MSLGGDVPVCLACNETDDETENSMNDELERRESSAFGPVLTLGHSACSTRTCDRAEQCCGCPGGRPFSVAREPLREAMRRSGRLSEAIAGRNEEVGTTADPPSMRVTCAEDAAMNEGMQCFQRDVTGSRCLDEEYGNNMLNVCLRRSAARREH